MIESAVSVSREWDAYAAGAEVAEKALSKLSQKPKFVLLFATIHYEKNGGFQKLLDGAYSKLPADVPLVGGTVAGFMHADGCCTRGAAAFAVYNDGMDVAVAAGRNTKRRPNLAAKDCANALKSSLSGSTYANKNFFVMASAAVVPNVPLIGGKKVLKRFPDISAFGGLLNSTYSALQIGPGRDEEVFGSFCNALDGWVGIGGGSCDDLRLIRNYQFMNRCVMMNSVVALGFATDVETEIVTRLGMKPTSKSFTITSAPGGGYMISRINGRPAVSEYLRMMEWNKDVLDERLYRKVFYYPFVHKDGDVLEPRMFGLVYGENFVCPIRVSSGKEYEIWTSSASDLINSTTGLADGGKISCGISISCGTRLETLGSAVFKIAKTLKQKLGDSFLLVYTAGEYAKHKDTKPACLYQSDNALLFR